MSSLSLKQVGAALKQKNMLIALLMGFSGGLPFLLPFKTLQGWLTHEGVDLKVLGYISLLGLPYSFKFLWSPLMDGVSGGKLGRRRFWLLITQVGILFAIFSLSFSNPAQNLLLASIFSFMISFFSASQDIVIDAYRRESVSDEQQGMAAALYNAGYRIALLVAGGLAFILADYIGWQQTYMLMGVFMLIGFATTFWCEEPPPSGHPPKTLKDAFIAPLTEFFQRSESGKPVHKLPVPESIGQVLFFPIRFIKNNPAPFLILAVVLLYKVGDSFAGVMLTPFYKHVGFSQTEIGTVAKTFGMISSLTGAFIGGAMILRLGITRALFAFGILQAISTVAFAALEIAGHSIPMFAFVVFLEDASSGMGSGAFMAFMATHTNKNYTATQLALLTSLMSIPRTIIAAPAGVFAEYLGWINFFIFSSLAAIPGLLLLWYMIHQNKRSEKIRVQVLSN